MKANVLPCCANSGGRVSLNVTGVNGSRQFHLRGAVTIRPTNTETEAQSNADGSMYVTTKAVPAEADITLSDHCGLRLEDLLNCYIDATIQLIDVGRTYLFTQSRVVGRPELKTDDGEISGLKIATQDVSWFEAAA